MKFCEMEYTRPDSEKFFNDLKYETNNFANAKSADEQFEIYLKVEDLYKEYEFYYNLARLRGLINVNDEFYKNEFNHLKKYLVLANNEYNELTKLILSSPYKEELTNKLGCVTMMNLEFSEKCQSEQIASDILEEKNLVQEYNAALSKLTVEFNGETMPLTLLAPFKESVDRSIRKKAYIAEGECYLKIKPQLDDIFDKLVKNRALQAKKLGFKNYVELAYMRMRRICYNVNDVSVFKKQVLEDIVPIASNIQKNRCERLGLDTMKFHDLQLTFKDGSAKLRISGDEIIDALKKMYSEMSPQTAEFVEMFTQNELYDLYPKVGKVPGGFCSYLKKYNYPFIFANFNGTSTDAYVLIHEVGHAFARYTANAKSKQIASPAMEISETHAMAMEFLATPWYELFFKQDAKKYTLSHAEDALIFIPYACQVDEFQKQIYLNPDMTPQMRDEKWLEIENKYRPHVDYGDIPFYNGGSGWQRQVHIYRNPFYYIDYALSQMMALQFFDEFCKDEKKAFELYLAFVEYFGNKTFVDLIETLNLKSPFKAGAIKEIAQNLEKWIIERQKELLK